MRVFPAAAVLALLASSLAAPGGALVPSQPSLVHGKGTATYDNVQAGIHCPGVSFDIELASTPAGWIVQMQGVHPEPGCNLNGYLYYVNPVLAEGTPEAGWAGEAVGVQCVPACLPEVPLVWPVWPTWPVTITPTGAPGTYALWSYYEDVNGRDYYFVGDFVVDVMA